MSTVETPAKVVEIDTDELAKLATESAGFVDPDPKPAPYGRTKDGTPKAKPGRKAGGTNRRQRRKPDKDPDFTKGVRDQATKPATGPDSRTIENALAGLLVMPAMPCHIFGDTYCATHFETAAVPCARQIVKASESSPALRRQLEKLVAGEAGMLIFMAAVMYLIPPLAHHGIVPPAMAGAIGAPPPPPRATPMPPVPAFDDDGVPAEPGVDG